MKIIRFDIYVNKLESLLAFCSADTKLLCEWYAYIVYGCIYVHMYVGSQALACMCVCGDIITHMYVYAYMLCQCIHLCI